MDLIVPYPWVPIPDNKLCKLLKYSYMSYYLNCYLIKFGKSNGIEVWNAYEI